MSILEKLWVLTQASTMIAITTFMIAFGIAGIDFIFKFLWGDDEWYCLERTGNLKNHVT